MSANAQFVVIQKIADSVYDGVNFLGKVILSGNVNFLKGWIVSEDGNNRLMISTSGVKILTPIDTTEQRVRRHKYISDLNVSIIEKIGVDSPLFDINTIVEELKKQFNQRSQEFDERSKMMKSFTETL